MERHRQTLGELLSSLSEIRLEQPWRDPLYEHVERQLAALGDKASYSRADLLNLLKADFEAGSTIVRLVLGLSRDEYEEALRAALQSGRTGVTGLRDNESDYLAALERVGILDNLRALASGEYTWRDVLLERLRSGRGSALKGQRRGRALEDLTENEVRTIFDRKYEVRCRFLGASGMSSEKCDFAIPTATDPGILIEVKAYGATGSKQTDILGDVRRIVEQKRPDTLLLLVTDGPTWRARQADLGKLVKLQNQGEIARIYTQRLLPALRRDLDSLRRELGIG